MLYLYVSYTDYMDPRHMYSTLVHAINLLVFNFQGPISIFNARNEWSAPRSVILKKNHDQGFGFSVRGDSPVRIAEIELGSVAEVSHVISHVIL